MSDPVINFKIGSSKMNCAMRESAHSLTEVLTHIVDPTGSAHSRFMLKVACPVQDVENEIIWVDSIQCLENSFAGTLANDPQHIKDKSCGSEVIFTQEQVRDWTFQGSDGKEYGHYTTRVLLKQVTDNTYADVRASLSENPIPW